MQHILFTSFKSSTGPLPGLSRAFLFLAAIGFCSPLTGKHIGEPVRQQTNQQQEIVQNSLVRFSESVRELSERSGPPSAFKTIDELHILPLSHHSLWDRLRDGFEFAELEHPKIDLQIEFLQNGMRSLHANLTAASPYLRHIVEQVERAGLPIDIAMLPLVESAFNPHAKSSQNALGLWQFIPDTGKLYGLEENDWYSGRKDVIASTEAAIRYLTRLHKTFDGDWLLALAAYNTGQGNLRSAIKRAKKQGQSTDFWNLRLAKETRDYVPRLIAVSKMISEPEAYGVILPPLSDRKSVSTVNFDAALSLQEASDISGISLRRLLELNPGYKKKAIPPNGPNRLLVPIEAAASLVNWVDNQRTPDATASTAMDAPAHDVGTFRKVDYRKYTVRRGDNLWNIARQFDTDLESLTNWNSIGSDSEPLQPGDELWYARLREDSLPPKEAKLIKYRVVTTDTIPDISGKFNTRLAELKKWNQSLRHTHSLNPGQILYIPMP